MTTTGFAVIWVLAIVAVVGWGAFWVTKTRLGNALHTLRSCTDMLNEIYEYAQTKKRREEH